MDNLLQLYKNYTSKQYNRYCYDGDFEPHFRRNTFDTNNHWLYDKEKGTHFVSGFQNIANAWEAWSYWMRDKKYSYKLPYAMWSEMNDGWMYMYEYSWAKK